MAVDVEEDAVAVLAGAHEVGQPAQPGEIVAVVEILTVLLGQPLSRDDLVLELALAPVIHGPEAMSLEGERRPTRAH